MRKGFGAWFSEALSICSHHRLPWKLWVLHTSENHVLRAYFSARIRVGGVGWQGELHQTMGQIQKEGEPLHVLLISPGMGLKKNLRTPPFDSKRDCRCSAPCWILPCTIILSIYRRKFPFQTSVLEVGEDLQLPGSKTLLHLPWQWKVSTERLRTLRLSKHLEKDL